MVICIGFQTFQCTLSEQLRSSLTQIERNPAKKRLIIPNMLSHIKLPFVILDLRLIMPETDKNITKSLMSPYRLLGASDHHSRG